MPDNTRQNRYSTLIESVFFDHYRDGIRSFEFARDELVSQSTKLGIELPRNLGDVIYSIRHRNPLPNSILATQPENCEWIIEGAGRSRYRFNLVRKTRIVPREDLIKTLIPDATPELIRTYALDDEQALLAIVRYNRLIDIFLGLTTYSLQNHLRTYLANVGQIEIDELYIGVDRYGCHYVIPVQAKGGNDQIGVVQTTQDILFSDQKFPGMRCKAVSAQFMADGTIALFELTVQESQVKIVQERHYKLVPSSEIDAASVRAYSD